MPPISSKIIDRVHKLADKDQQPAMRNGFPIFEWNPGMEMDRDDWQDASEENETSEEINVEELARVPLEYNLVLIMDDKTMASECLDDKTSASEIGVTVERKDPWIRSKPKPTV